MAAVFKINGTNGEVIWQLGGLRGGSNFELQPEDRFAYQHHARFRGRRENGNIETISLFDNGDHSAPVNKTHPSSRARVYEIDHNKGTARAVRTFEAPDGLSAGTQGSLQFLPNNNKFVNWGQAGAITEFDDQGNILFHSYLDSAPHGILVQTYRAFRFNWTGIPAEEPVVVASRQHARANLDVYVSWNGDTETAYWRIYAQFPPSIHKEFLGEVNRDGFETHGKFDVSGTRSIIISAEAIDSSHKILVRSRPTKVVAQDVPLSDTLPSKSQWTIAEEL